MPIARTHFRIVFAVVAASLLSFGCASHKVNNSWPNDVTLTQRAVVKTILQPGGVPDPAKNLERLKAYYLELQGLVGVTSLEDQFIGCVPCRRLSDSPPPDDLTFFFYREHRVDLYAFITAWERVQASPIRHPNFALTFDLERPPQPACPQAPPACWPSGSCGITDYCDQSKTTQGCQRCPAP